MATSGECLFNGAVPVYLRTTNAAVGGTGSQFSVPTTVGGIHERGRRVDSILFEVLTPTNLHGRRVRPSFLCLMLSHPPSLCRPSTCVSATLTIPSSCGNVP